MPKGKGYNGNYKGIKVTETKSEEAKVTDKIKRDELYSGKTDKGTVYSPVKNG